MSRFEIGQVLWLRIRFNNDGAISSSKHPYLIVEIDDILGTIEIAQIDSLNGKEFKALFKSNIVIFAGNPRETVIYKDSYVQLDNTIIVDNYEGLVKYRKTTDKLSTEKLSKVLSEYSNYHHTNHIDENKNVYLSKEEIESLNG